MLHHYVQLVKDVPRSPYYFKNKGGLEVDFIVPLREHASGQEKMLVQVCESMALPQTRKREVAALREAMAELGIASGTIVTRNEEDDIEVELPMPRSPALDSMAGRSRRPGRGKIAVVPAWRFLPEIWPEDEKIGITLSTV